MTTDPKPKPRRRKPAADPAKQKAAEIVDGAATTTGETGAVEAGAKEKGPSQATMLVQIAEKSYALGCTPDGEPFAIPRQGPQIVRLLRGGRQSLRAELAQAYYELTGSAASQSALSDACTVIEGQAQRLEPTELHLRVAGHAGRLVLDVGDAAARCVVIDAAGWVVVDVPPVMFRRSALTGALPLPVRGGSLDSDLWPALNVAERYRPLLVAVLVAALIPDIPHPVVLLSGEQGTGKSTATGRLASVLDPSPAQLRKAPRDADTAVTAAAGSWMPALDNLSGMPDWLSDELCRWSTGNGDVRRRLYTDSDLHVIAFRRAPIINGIDLGALRGDLADRLVHIVLDRIPDADRLAAKVMDAQWRDAHPRVLGALLDIAVQVLAALPDVQLDGLPRMADYALILAAVDKVLGTQGMATFLGLRDELAQDAATSDPVLVALIDKIAGPFTGTSADLLTMLTPVDDDGKPDKKWRSPKGWPDTARGLTTVLNRQAPTLRQLGWTVDKSKDHRGKALEWALNPPARSANGGAEQRRSAEHPADAADAANGLFPQVNHHAGSAATGAASVSQHEPDAAPAANAAGRGTDAAPDAAPSTPPLSSANGDHAASAASALSIADPLCSVTSCAGCAAPLGSDETCGDCWHAGRVDDDGRLIA